jgi:formate dehydrogenase subunit gamma
MAALSFLYAALTGLALFSHRLYWLSEVFGGGVAVRRWHPWGGLLFSLALGVLFRNWASQMKLDGRDRAWLARAHRYAVHDERDLPEAGRFNGGQKLLFWLQSAAVLFLLASGVVLWFPEAMPRTLRLAAVLVHPTTAVLSMLGIVLHVYMGTTAVPGAFRGMTQGWVSRAWARSHHPKWFRDVERSRERDAR